MHVLLLEPNKLLAGTYQVALERAGHTVTCSGGAQEAIHALDAGEAEIIVLELQLRGHSGIEFLYELRSYPEWQRIPTILHTFVGMESLELQQKQFDLLGVTHYLYKPATSLRQLVRAVDEASLIRI